MSASAVLTVSVGSAVGLASLKVPDAKGLPPGGYVLAIGRGADGQAHVVLEGADAAGTFYAAQTLRRLVRGRRLPSVAVRDWPSLAIRGVVEGFYGPPWPDRERLAMLDFLAAHKLNAYVYSPKDDAYARARWRDPYPAGRLAALHALAARATADHVTFTYALSPGLSICFSSATDLRAVFAKLESLWAVGVRSFAIPLDDIDYRRFHCRGDDARFGSGPAAAATAQAHLLNAIDRAFVATHPGAGRLITVPTEYANVASTAYTRTLAALLAPDVVVEWTGGAVFARSISRAEAGAARGVYGHDVLLWDNYPVADERVPRVLRLAPYRGREPGLSSALLGITANPMIQPEATKIPLFTIADYAWNDSAYDPGRSWAASLDEFAGGDAAVAAALRAFADVDYASALDPRQAPELSARIAAFWRSWKAGGSRGVAALRVSFAALRDAPRLLRARLADARFLAETSPWLDAARTWGAAGLAAIDLLQASRAGRRADAQAAARAMRALGARARSFSDVQDGRRFPVEVAGGVLDAFLADALAAAVAASR